MFQRIQSEQDAAQLREVILPATAFRKASIVERIQITDQLARAHQCFDAYGEVELRFAGLQARSIERNAAGQLVFMAWGQNHLPAERPSATANPGAMDPYRQFRREIEIDFYVLGAQDEIPDLLARGTNSLVCGPSDRFAGSAGTLKLIISTCRLPEAENVATVSQIQGSILSGPQNLAVASDQWARSVIQAALKVINYLGYSSFEMDCDLPGWFRIPVPLSEVRKGFLEGCLVKYAAQAGFSLFRMTSGLLEFKRPTEVPRLVHQYQIERCEESPRGFCRSLHEAVFARSYARGTEMRLSI